MSEPLICCIMPTRDRPEMAARSVRCFASQFTIARKCMIILDNADESHGGIVHAILEGPIQYQHSRSNGRTVGALRNNLLTIAAGHPLKPDYIAHFEDDDISSRDRLQIQLEHIQQTKKLVTGFYNCPLYDVKNDKVWIYEHEDRRYALGTSLFYKREAWERVKFPDKTPEDPQWLRDIGAENRESRSVFREDGTPIMIQTIHGANASASIIRSSPRYREATDEQSRAVREILKNA